MCLCRRSRFLIWLCLNGLFGLDILFNNVRVTDNEHQLESVNTDLNGPLSSSLSGSSFALSKENDLKVKVRLLCWIRSSSAFRSSISHGEKLIRETWGKRCDRLLFVFATGKHNRLAEQMTETDDAGVVRLFGRTTSEVLEYLYDHHINDTDWFLKAEEDTYVVTEQLEAMLSVQDATTPCYLAANTKEDPTLGETYVLSRESVLRLVHYFRHPSDVNSSPDDAICKEWTHYGNSSKDMVALSRLAAGGCLYQLGIASRSTQDERGCERFLSYRLATELGKNATNSGHRCVSPIAVVFSRIQHNQFYVYEHLLYRLSLLSRASRKGSYNIANVW